MRTSVERFRVGLVVGAGLLVLVIAGFFGYARYRVGKVIADLPGKLGATVTKEFNGYTYSQSDAKRTIFTIHAAKAMQHSDGKYTLHDVSMVLYGRAGDRADSISGDDFEYDTKAQVVKAIGVVHLDLGATAAADGEARKHLAGPASVTHDDAALDSRIIHVKTSGLVYSKQTGTATTDQPLEFVFSGYTGHAVGAEYNSTTGHVLLQSLITLSGVDRGRPVALRASHGELDRAARLAEFRDARYSSAGEVAQADMTQFHLREDNSIERVDCTGRVGLEDGAQGRVNSQRAQVWLTEANRPKSATLAGAVHFVQERAARQASGASERASLEFDEQGRLEHALLSGRVKTAERSGALDVGMLERTLSSETQETWLAATGAAMRPQVRDIKATGSVLLTTAGFGSGNDPAARKLSADTLTAHLVDVNGSPEIASVHGNGHTAVEQTSVDGVFQKSSGETLDATFRPGADNGRKDSAELVSAVQQGAVAIERSVPSKTNGGPADVQHAKANRAAYDAESNLLTLTGEVAMNDAGRQVLASKVVIAQATGNATAEGGVKVTYQQAGSTEPAHVLAARAELNHAGGKAIFYGRAMGVAGSGLARLWQAESGGQGGSQIEAPVLVFEGVGGPQKGSRLTARAETRGEQGTVRALLAQGRAANASKQPSKTLSDGPARIVSSEMVYSDVDRGVEFTGGVRMVQGTSEVKSQTATVFLAAAQDSGRKKAKDAADGHATLPGGEIERVVASHQVEVMQPGRKANGERLVYTASDEIFVLTGTAAAPPRVVDAKQGSTTGAELRFHAADGSVVISGADGSAPARKVETETRVKQQ